MPKMKRANFISGFILVLFTANCSTDKEHAQADALHFNWTAPQRFLVTETIQKKQTEMQVVHECELQRTNDGYVLQWLDAKIIEFNGASVSSSEDLKHAVEPAQESFIYPAFRIGSNGEFVEAMDLEGAVKKVNQMLDTVVTNRDEDNRKFFSKYVETEAGKQVLNVLYGQIWRTWVEAWTDVALSEGQSVSATGTVTIFQDHEVPAVEKLTNLGPVKSNTNLLSLKFEQRLSVTNFSAAINGFIENAAQETGLKGAGPLTNECTMVRLTSLETQTERQTLRPYWAKSTATTTISSPGETNETESEIHEYKFNWSP